MITTTALAAAAVAPALLVLVLVAAAPWLARHEQDGLARAGAVRRDRRSPHSSAAPHTPAPVRTPDISGVPTGRGV
ncbi:hypothetical protein [Pseudonocardia phyllosphaerae]|uniref:hypothetical protein n=1 Tax=Pseudonocardia phyllosphaerae TaxID=3390502 RepID=UPI00397C1D67